MTLSQIFISKVPDTLIPAMCKKYYKSDSENAHNPRLAYVYPDYIGTVLDLRHFISFLLDSNISQITQNEVQTITLIGHHSDVAQNWKCPQFRRC